MSSSGLHHLPRLERRLYQAFAVVHWNMNVLPPIAGWLGLSLQSDQLNGMRFLRTQLNRLLQGNALEKRKSAVDSRPQPQDGTNWELQPQAHDRVLREKERKKGAFASLCFYVLANPVRAELVTREAEWPFSGAVMPGYPDLYPFQDGYWESFWKLYEKHREPTPAEPLPA